MNSKKIIAAATAGITIASLATAPALAAKGSAEAEVMKCDASHGTIAITDGDTQGWTKFGLSSPRGMLGAIVQESGCFTLHTGVDGRPANYLMSAVAGSQEEIDQTMNMAKGALTEGLVRSGAAGSVLSSVPMGGALIGMFGGLGGKKKTITAGLRLMNPSNGQTLISGSGQSQKSTIKVLSGAGWVAASQGQFGQYSSSKDGKMVASAFIEAFNSLASQAGALGAVQQVATPAAAPISSYKVAVATKMMDGPAETSAEVRDLRADTTLIPTGSKEGLFVEVTDNYGTKGWVSVEDLR
ncbi:SH3 domain-containing protein [Parasphingorhabdus halotolerans]|uniref:SH3 domain-containing protein n=1 Tax=Parasphingorhabdus halotolerans TaxID=2725558 RepID=A0A6H2DQ49_9SPHN|nr:SH3 domain-containing protein [Parasphingorhabdus halotolerans]QJB70464.1 SH3 domain-containing protein [Parasphingorhabdus halotolerans]